MKVYKNNDVYLVPLYDIDNQTILLKFKDDGSRHIGSYKKDLVLEIINAKTSSEVNKKLPINEYKPIIRYVFTGDYS